MTQYFVADYSFKDTIKKTQLRKVMAQGSKWSTPLEKKALFVPVFMDQRIVAVVYFNPDAPGTSEYIKLNWEVYISKETWHKMMKPVEEFESWSQGHEAKERVRHLLARLEEASIEHGKRVATSANGFISSPEPYLYESGAALRRCREDIYKELNV